jgi:hypothetical protein
MTVFTQCAKELFFASGRSTDTFRRGPRKNSASTEVTPSSQRLRTISLLMDGAFITPPGPLGWEVISRLASAMAP